MTLPPRSRHSTHAPATPPRSAPSWRPSLADKEPLINASVRKLMREHSEFGMNPLTPEMVVEHFRKLGWREPRPSAQSWPSVRLVDVVVPEEVVTDPEFSDLVG